MRILILTNRVPYPLHDGGALAMDAIIRGYAKAGMEVYVLAMNTSRHKVEDEVLAKLYTDLADFETVTVNNDVKPLKLLQNLLLSRKPEHAARFYHPAFAEKLQQVLGAFRPDIVQMESPFLSSYLPLIKNARTVLRVHNVEYQIWERLAAEQKGIKSRYLRTLAKRMRNYEALIWGQYDLLLPITDIDAALIKRSHPAQKMCTAPYGIEVAQDHSKPASFYTAYHIGAMDWRPNAAAIDWLLQDIWPGIKSEVPEAQFFFGGRNMPLRFKVNLPEGAHCAGEIGDIIRFIADKQILVVPLRAGGGIRVKILEAMAAGKLVISTAIGMQGILAETGVHYLEANTPDEFVAAFHLANHNPQAVTMIVNNALQLILAAYSDTAIISRILAAFQQMIQPDA